MKLQELKQLLESFKPKNILELGSGKTTIIFAQYCKDNNANLLSIDENEEYAEKTRKLLKKSDLNAEILVFKRNHYLIRKNIYFFYDFNLEDKFDFIYVDGSSKILNGVKYKKGINIDAIKFKKAKWIVVDGRIPTVKYLKKHFKDYKLIKSYYFKHKWFRYGRYYHSILIKGD